MNYDVLHNFISPVTGRVLCKEDYILVGNRDNIADPSPALIDTKLDLIKLRHDVNELLNATFILEEANFKLPKAQALNILDDGFMYNTGGIISTTNDIPLPSLEYKHLWIGDSNNKPQAVTTIDIDNLPSLGTTDVPTPTGGFVGKVWEGTAQGRPEESSIVGEMFADIGILNAKFLAGHFVMNSGLTASFPAAQFLNALTAGALVKTSSTGNGKLESVVINQDQVLMGGANNVPESRARIGVENLPLLADKKLWSGNADSIPQSITTIDISNLPNLTNNNLWVGGEDNRPIAKVNIDITNLPNLEQNKLWIGGAGNRPVAQSTLNIDNLPNLTNNMVWQGNAQGRPAEVELNFAPDNATYILQTPTNGLSNAQTLNTLGGGILKTTPLSNGAISIASGGKVPVINDYVRPLDLIEVVEIEKGERVTADTVLEAEIAALEAEFETQIAVLAGVETINILATILGWIGLAANTKNYAEYIRGQTLNVKNTWTATDKNDEGHNAVGDFEFRFPSGYSSSNRGYGTLWFDSQGRNENHKSEPGLRIFSWDSGGDHLGYDDPIAPIHIGIFGYQNKYHTWPIPNPTPVYKGFIFRSEFYNGDSGDDDYRFPKNFGLYDVTRTISTLTTQSWGWDQKNTIFEYDYNYFYFYQKVELKQHTIFKDTAKFEKEVIFEDDIICSGTGIIKIPTGTTAQRPVTPAAGMMRFNTSL